MIDTKPLGYAIFLYSEPVTGLIDNIDAYSQCREINEASEGKFRVKPIYDLRDLVAESIAVEPHDEVSMYS